MRVGGPLLWLLAVVAWAGAERIPADLNSVKQNIQKQNRETVLSNAAQGFEWGSMLGMALKLLVGGPRDGAPNHRQETIAQLTKGELTWTKMISLAMEIVLTLVGGNEDNHIDRQDVEPSPVENILSAVIAYMTGLKNQGEVNLMAKQATELLGVLVSLLDALRTSFSQRSAAARSLGSTDSLAEAAVATTAMFKGLLRSYRTEDEVCMRRFLCEASAECVDGATDAGYLFCQVGTYGVSYLLEKSTSTSFDMYEDAGHRGRVGEDCIQVYRDCNQI